MSTNEKNICTGGNTLTKVLSFTVDKAIELANANSVVGDRIVAGDITIIPISKLSVGFAGGGADIADVQRGKQQNPAGAGAKVSLTPISFLVICDGTVQLLNMAAEEGGSAMGNIVGSVIEQAVGMVAASKQAKAQAQAEDAQ